MQMTENEKRQLEVIVEGGRAVSTVAYFQSTVIGDPEKAARDAGWTQYARQAVGDFIEIIYIK